MKGSKNPSYPVVQNKQGRWLLKFIGASDWSEVLDLQRLFSEDDEMLEYITQHKPSKGEFLIFYKPLSDSEDCKVLIGAAGILDLVSDPPVLKKCIVAGDYKNNKFSHRIIIEAMIRVAELGFTVLEVEADTERMIRSIQSLPEHYKSRVKVVKPPYTLL